MKGTEKIIAHILSDAQDQSNAILAQAKQQASQIQAEYDQQAAALYGEKIRAGVKLVSDETESAERLDRMEGKKELLALKQEMISKSFALAQEKLTKLDDEKYVALLAKLAAASASYGDEEIVLNAADREKVGAAVLAEANKALGEKGKLRLSESTGEFAGGLILRRGNIEVNCTVELLVELCRSELAATIAGVLFD